MNERGRCKEDKQSGGLSAINDNERTQHDPLMHRKLWARWLDVLFLLMFCEFFFKKS